MIDDFLGELDRQTALYREMIGTSELPRLQALMREIAQIDVKLAPVRRRWPDVCRRLDPETAARANRSVDAARDVLARLVERMAPPVPARRISEAYGS